MNIVEPIRKKQDIVSLENFLKKRGLRDLLLFVLGTNSGLRISDILLRIKLTLRYGKRKPENLKNFRLIQS